MLPNLCLLLVTCNRKMIERWRWSYCVTIVNWHRLMCIFTIDHYLTLRLHDLRSKSDFDILGSTNRYSFDAPRRDKHDGVWLIALTFFVKKLLTKNSMAFSGFWPELEGQLMTQNYKVGYCRLSLVRATHSFFCQALAQIGVKRLGDPTRTRRPVS